MCDDDLSHLKLKSENLAASLNMVLYSPNVALDEDAAIVGEDDDAIEEVDNVPIQR
jgi:hypothetical protein